jgi:DHA1 family multidrug resistance protein-like MFS transporter
MNAYGRNLLVLSLLFLVNSLAIDVISPIWPVFINAIGASMTELGVVFSISTAMGALMQIPSGWLADKYGGRRLHILGQVLHIIPPLMYTYAGTWVHLIPWVALSGLASGLLIPIRTTIIADVSSSQTMASAYSWTNIAMLAGSTAAPFIGGLIADTLGILVPFFTRFMLSFAILPLVLLLRETRKPPPSPEEAPQNVSSPPISGYQATLVWLSLVNIIQGIGMGVTGPITPIFVTANFQVDYTFLGILYAIGFGVASIIVQIPGAKCSSRFDRRKVMAVTFVASAPFFLLFAYARNPLELVVFMFLSYVILNLHWPAYQSYLMDATPSAKWGFVNGISMTTFWVGVVMGNAASGVLWDRFGMLAPFYVSGVALAISAFPLIPLKEHRARDR